MGRTGCESSTPGEQVKRGVVSSRRGAARHAVIVFVVHGVVAIGVLSLDWTRRGGNVLGWDSVRLLRLVEWPVVWLIDGILQRFLIIPVEWCAPHFELCYRVNIALTYILVGGTFYGALAACVSLLLGTRRASRPWASPRAIRQFRGPPAGHWVRPGGLPRSANSVTASDAVQLSASRRRSRHRHESRSSGSCRGTRSVRQSMRMRGRSCPRPVVAHA